MKNQSSSIRLIQLRKCRKSEIKTDLQKLLTREKIANGDNLHD